MYFIYRIPKCLKVMNRKPEIGALWQYQFIGDWLNTSKTKLKSKKSYCKSTFKVFDIANSRYMYM